MLLIHGLQARNDCIRCSLFTLSAAFPERLIYKVVIPQQSRTV